ncbi:MAG: molecular chaperone GrpE [Saprospiraceae bacterium]|jgi:molecular chaperone GrpE
MNDKNEKEETQEKEEATTDQIEDQEEKIAEPELSEEEKKDAKIAGLEDKYLRLFSEYENFRKRTSREKSELITASKADTFKVLLPVLDDFDRALKSIGDASDVDSLKEGVNLIYDKVVMSLGAQGLKEMDILEKEFNAEEHEAITNIPAPTKKLKGKILDVVEKGYILNEKIIRFPKVVVGA